MLYLREQDPATGDDLQRCFEAYAATADADELLANLQRAKAAGLIMRVVGMPHVLNLQNERGDRQTVPAYPVLRSATASRQPVEMHGPIAGLTITSDDYLLEMPLSEAQRFQDAQKVATGYVHRYEDWQPYSQTTSLSQLLSVSYAE